MGVITNGSLCVIEILKTRGLERREVKMVEERQDWTRHSAFALVTTTVNVVVSRDRR
jgi:hypothetical protein